jgi:hypothetical protein
MGRDFPGNPSPVGKPSINARKSVESKGGLTVRSGHGTGYAQESLSFSGTGGGKSGKKLCDDHSGHGKEYGQETRRG